MENFEKRLAALEKINARYRMLLVGALVISVYFIIASFSPHKIVPDLIQAKKFELVDDYGNVLARIENFDGSGAMTTYKPNGSILTDIVATKGNSGGIVVYDGNGRKNILLTDVTGGGGSVVINNSSEQKVLSLGRNTQNAGSVTFYNGSSNEIGLITGDTNNDGVVLTYNNGGSQTARVPN